MYLDARLKHVSKKQKLELTWIGKENRPRLEPRILLEDPEKSYHAAHRIAEHDLFATQTLSHEQLQQLGDEVGTSRTLLVVCSAFRGSKEGYPNLTVKKIPKAVLARCEWGHDDYSLKVENLPKAPPKPGQQELF